MVVLRAKHNFWTCLEFSTSSRAAKAVDKLQTLPAPSHVVDQVTGSSTSGNICTRCLAALCKQVTTYHPHDAACPAVLAALAGWEQSGCPLLRPPPPPGQCQGQHIRGEFGVMLTIGLKLNPEHRMQLRQQCPCRSTLAQHGGML